MKQRVAVRVLLRDEQGAFLLFRDSDPGLPGVAWWMTPGGGIDAGETPVAAAVRELAEETGIVVTPPQVVGPVAHRVVVHGYSDQVTVQDELFFAVTVTRFEVSTAGHTEEERQTITTSAWLTFEELADQSLPVWPARLAEIAAWPDGDPVELGVVEESTVRVGLGCRDPQAVAAWTTGRDWARDRA